jgi:hypothetical protein
MKQVIKLMSGLFIAVPLLFTACKKQAGDETNPIADPIKAKVTAWLEKQKTNNADRNQRIQNLVDHLDFGKMRFEERTGIEKIAVIPVKDGFKTSANKNKDVSSYVIMFDDGQGELRNAYLWQYLPAPGEGKELPVGIFSKIYTSQEVPMKGTFTLLTVTGRFLSQQEYKNDGKLSRHVELIAPQNNQANGTRTEGCTDWYIVTTVYVNGTPVSQTSEYVGTTCDCTPNDPNLASLDCPGNGDVGGGNGNPTPFYPVTKQVQWTVKADAGLGWHVDSYEKLDGMKPPAGSIELPYFTAITHQNDAIFNTYSTNSPAYTTWQRLAVNTSLIGNAGAAAKCEISGKTTNMQFGEQPIGGAKPWLAAHEF